jgi:NADH dehydrogenase
MVGRVFVTGGTGFVGSSVIETLLARGYEIAALVHRRGIGRDDVRVHHVKGELFDVQALTRGMEGCRAIIHLVGIIREKPKLGATFQRVHVEATQCILNAAGNAGVKRLVHMSALGTRVNAISQYHRTKWAAEELVRASGLDWTIIRPSLIHGPGGEFMQMEARWARGTAAPYLFMPYFGKGLFGTGGSGRLQPVYVGDVARAFADAIERPQTVGKVYELGGAQIVTWPELHRTCAEVIVGRRRWVAAIPTWKARLWLAVVPNSLLPFNQDQVVMSQEDNTCDLAAFVRDFGWEPAGFEESLRAYAMKNAL